MSVNVDIYYFSVIDFLRSKSAQGIEVTRQELDIVIKKKMGVKCTKKVVQRLKQLGYIVQEDRKIIKFIKEND